MNNNANGFGGFGMGGYGLGGYGYGGFGYRRRRWNNWNNSVMQFNNEGVFIYSLIFYVNIWYFDIKNDQ